MDKIETMPGHPPVFQVLVGGSGLRLLQLFVRGCTGGYGGQLFDRPDPLQLSPEDGGKAFQDHRKHSGRGSGGRLLPGGLLRWSGRSSAADGDGRHPSLVPGLAFTNGIRDLADGDYISGAVRMLDAILVFVSLGAGVGAVFLAYHHMFGGVLLWIGQLTAAFLGTVAFGYLFGIPGKHYGFCGLCGSVALGRVCAPGLGVGRDRLLCGHGDRGLPVPAVCGAQALPGDGISDRRADPPGARNRALLDLLLSGDQPAGADVGHGPGGGENPPAPSCWGSCSCLRSPRRFFRMLARVGKKRKVSFLRNM